MKQPKSRSELDRKDGVEPMSLTEAIKLMKLGIIIESVVEGISDLYRITPKTELELQNLSISDIGEFSDQSEWEWSYCEQSFNELSEMEYKTYVKKETFVFNLKEFENYLDTIIGEDYDNKKTLKNRIKRIVDVVHNYKK